MLQRSSVVRAAACLEIVAGAALLTVPGIACQLVFATNTKGVEIALARFAGVGLLALGIACLPSTVTGSSRSAFLGLLVFNFGVAVLFAWLGLVTTLHGVLLWPAVLLHAVIAVTLPLSITR